MKRNRKTNEDMVGTARRMLEEDGDRYLFSCYKCKSECNTFIDTKSPAPHEIASRARAIREESYRGMMEV